MNVDPASAAAHTEHHGTTYHFCSTRCHDAFTADPDQYRSGPATHAHH